MAVVAHFVNAPTVALMTNEMKMGTVVPGTSPPRNHAAGSILSLTSRLILAGFLLLVSGVTGGEAQSIIPQIQRDFDNGLFEAVAERVRQEIARGQSRQASADVALLAASSLIVLERFDEARRFLDEARSIAERNKNSRADFIARVYLGYSALERARREFRPAIEFAKRARLAAPNDTRIEGEFFFNIGRVLYSMGDDISAMIWLEKARKSLESKGESELILDVYRYLALTSAARFQYAKAIAYYEKLITLSENSRFRRQHRLALYELAGVLNACGRKRLGTQLLKKALSLSLSANNLYQAKTFLASLLMNALYEANIDLATTHLRQLERIDPGKTFGFEIVLGRAVIAALRGQMEIADRHFEELGKLKEFSAHLVPYWKATIAEKNKDWKALLEHNTVLLKLAEESNFRDDLPGIYLGIAKAHLGEGDFDKAGEFTQRAIAIVEEARKADDTALSVGMIETYHTAYRLMAQLRERDTENSLALADFVKARVLKDRIDDSLMRSTPDIPAQKLIRIEELSSKFVEGNVSADELEKLEKEMLRTDSESIVRELAFADKLRGLKLPPGVIAISYLFTPEGQLRAYVVSNERPVQVVKLPISEGEVESFARATIRKIKDLVFFKRDGKELYDRLLAPLQIDAGHLIIVPDKSLWRIPFHALSADSSSYLIENKLVSYAPSVVTLLDSLKKPRPVRRTIRVFANNLYRNRFLRHADSEAMDVARIFSSKPSLNSTAADFLANSGEADILHFSMHAQAEPEEPLNSFLGFRPTHNHDGRVTAEDLLNVRFKPRSLAFLASCDTSNVLSGEGLVSIAWAMLGSGSTSVISAQWEANDRSTRAFSEIFHKKYREGHNAAKSLQDASIDMIRNKSRGSHEPYYWAAFTLLGDYR